MQSLQRLRESTLSPPLRPDGRVATWTRAVAPLVGGTLVIAVASVVIPLAQPIPSLIAAVFFGLYAVRQFRRTQELSRRSEDVAALVNSGRIDEAEAALHQLLVDSRWTGLAQAILLYDLSVCWIVRGEVASARALLLAVDESGWLHSHPTPLGLVRGALAEVHTLMGDTVLGRHWVDLALQTTSPARIGTVMPARALLAAREGRFADALNELETGWGATEGVSPPSRMRELHVLRAYCLVRGQVALPSSPEVRRSLDAAMPLGPWDLVAWCRVWPEFHAFVYGTLGPAAANGPG